MNSVVKNQNCLSRETLSLKLKCPCLDRDPTQNPGSVGWFGMCELGWDLTELLLHVTHTRDLHLLKQELTTL